MKNSYDLEKQIDARYQRILGYDKRQIDNPDWHHQARLDYLDRIKTLISIIKRRFPVPDQIRIGDFACAQGNMCLILAEMGYKTFGIDINSTYIEYSKLKHEKGDIEWIVGSVDNLDFPEGMLDLAIAGELIEHCAYPEEIIKKIFRYIRPDGLLIITTPNGSRIMNRLPTFKKILSREARKKFEERQFGPDLEDHLFLFRLDEIGLILPKDSEVTERCYLGGTVLINRYSRPFLRLFPVKLIECVIRMLSKVPIINTKTFNNICVVVRKK